MNRQPTDNSLWEQFKAGRARALSCLFDQHVSGLMGYGLLFTPDKPTIEDCVQDVFVNLWEKRASLGEVVSVKHYLCASLRRRLLRKLRTQNRLRGSDDLLSSPAMPAEASYETWLLRRQSDQEVKDALQTMIARLTPQQKRVVYLKFYERLSYEEIAQLMTLNKRTVYNTCSAAIKQLQQQASATPLLRTLLTSAVSSLILVAVL
jgi:RNA polymerase sigma-70 factor (ECF subfamily)